MYLYIYIYKFNVIYIHLLKVEMKSTQVRSLTLTSAHYIALFPLSTFCRLQPVSLTGLCIRYAYRSISPIQADGGNRDIRSLICWFHSRHTVSPVPDTVTPTIWGIHSFLCKEPICSADFKLQGYPTGDPITGLV